MKFDCRDETWSEEKARRAQWRKWFAWLPVRLADRDCRWLEVVERRELYESGYDGNWYWEYRECS